ncbi:hypothetical protein GCM10020000_38950 [Streptomyces olivoverticillatus]
MGRLPVQSTMQDVPLTVSRILAHGARVHGGAEVTTWTGDGEPERRTFAEIGVRATRLAHALRALGVAEGEPVGTLMWNNGDHVEAYLAIPSMGAVLHTLNLRLPAEQLVWIVRHAADRVVIVSGSVLPLLAPLLPGLDCVEHVVVSGPGDLSLLEGCRPRVHSYEELIADHPGDHYPWPELDEKQAAALCYTSGTTGEPKGVVYSHRSVYLHAMEVNAAASFGLTPAEVCLPVVPMFHVNAWGAAARRVHGRGLAADAGPLPAARTARGDDRGRAAHGHRRGAHHLAGPAGRARRTAARRVVAAHGHQRWFGVPARADEGVRGAARAAARPGLGHDRDLAAGHGRLSARRAGCGGGVAVPHHPGTAARLRGGPAGRARRRDPALGRAVGRASSRCAGRGSRAPTTGGAKGEPHRPEDKFSADGWLRTGDVGTITPDGFLTLTDRAKDVIKSGGEWISSVELENHLMAHPEIAEAAVVAVPDEKWGERPLAAVVLRDGSVVDYEGLRAFLSERVARWQLPERWALVPSVPKTSVGKFDKKALRKRYADGELVVTTLG